MTGDRACPPEPPLHFAIVLNYLLWNIAPERMPQRAGAEDFVPCLKRASRKIF